MIESVRLPATYQTCHRHVSNMAIWQGSSASPAPSPSQPSLARPGPPPSGSSRPAQPSPGQPWPLWVGEGHQHRIFFVFWSHESGTARPLGFHIPKKYENQYDPLFPDTEKIRKPIRKKNKIFMAPKSLSLGEVVRPPWRSRPTPPPPPPPSLHHLTSRDPAYLYSLC